MNISLRWLRALADFSAVTDDQIIEQLTLLGLEVEAVEPYETVKGNLQGVVVGLVETVVQHPDADRLRVCSVRIAPDGDLQQIVCGAPNVAQGQKVPVATIGTTLYPAEGEPLVIKKSKIRGVESFGMICAEDELGIGKSHEGILVLPAESPIGAPMSEILKLYSDQIIVIGLTPNRTDAMSHYGVARDLAAYFGIPINFPDAKAEHAFPCSISVEVKDTERCPRYSGMEIRGIKVGESPEWLKNQLLAIGQRPINNIVDVTNYVMFEIGQPLHAFDAKTIAQQKIIVQTVGVGTTFITLDEKKHSLQTHDLMICDAERPLCMAGVMGGLNSGVTDATTDIFLESAYFAPSAIRKTSTQKGIFSETAYRFARGTDPNITTYALLRAAQLIIEIAGGTCSQITDQAFADFSPVEIAFSFSKANQLMGTNLPQDQIISILNRLDISVKNLEGDTAVVAVPRYRTDVTRFQDVVEEVIRQYGLNNIVIPSQIKISPNFSDSDEAHRFQERVLNQLSASGFYEIRTNSLGPMSRQTDTAVVMLNPLSEETAVMRESMLPSGLEVITHNLNRQQSNIRLYELGKVYHKQGEKFIEDIRLALYVSGKSHPDHWQTKINDTDYFDLKGKIENLFDRLGLAVSFQLLQEDEELSYGQELLLHKKNIGKIGKVKNSITKAFDVKAEVFYATIDWQAVYDQAKKQKITYAELSKFPSVRRDLSMLVSPGISYAEIEQAIREGGKNLIHSVDIFDVYQPKDSTEISYAVAITLSDPKQTLEEAVITKTMDKVMERLEKTGKISLRK